MIIVRLQSLMMILVKACTDLLDIEDGFGQKLLYQLNPLVDGFITLVYIKNSLIIALFVNNSGKAIKLRRNLRVSSLKTPNDQKDISLIKAQIDYRSNEFIGLADIEQDNENIPGILSYTLAELLSLRVAKTEGLSEIKSKDGVTIYVDQNLLADRMYIVIERFNIQCKKGLI